jgi:hypothetical protein
MREPCDSYCEHGGVCELEKGHAGLHDSRYCQWDDEHALTKDAADEVLIRDNPETGPLIAGLDGLLRDVLKASRV